MAVVGVLLLLVGVAVVMAVVGVLLLLVAMIVVAVVGRALLPVAVVVAMIVALLHLLVAVVRAAVAVVSSALLVPMEVRVLVPVLSHAELVLQLLDPTPQPSDVGPDDDCADGAHFLEGLVARGTGGSEFGEGMPAGGRTGGERERERKTDRQRNPFPHVLGHPIYICIIYIYDIWIHDIWHPGRRRHQHQSPRGRSP